MAGTPLRWEVRGCEAVLAKIKLPVLPWSLAAGGRLTMRSSVINKPCYESLFKAIAALILYAAAVGLGANELPKQFDFVVTFTYSITSSQDIKLGENDYGNSWQGDMVAINDAGGVFMNNTAGKCADFGLTMGGTREGVGACFYEDSDGDRLYETYRLHTDPEPITIEFVGGTGKYTGIKCKGEAKIIGWGRGGAGGVGKKMGSCNFAQ